MVNPSPPGVIALMGSGEWTFTMVEVQKQPISGLSVDPRPVFLDTPAGFQLNVGHIAVRTVDYFARHVGLDPVPSPDDKRKLLAPPAEALLALREDFRRARHWKQADAARDALNRAGMTIEDVPDGPRWDLQA